MKRKSPRLLSFPAILLLLLTTAPPPVTLSQALPAASPDPPTAPAGPLAGPPYYLSDPNVADAPYGRAPTIDGRIAPGEYAGAFKLTTPTYGGTLEAFIRQDATTLYVAMDSPDSTPYPYASGGGIGPALQLFLDTNLDRASTPQNDDYRLTLRKNSTTKEDRGDGSGWGGAGTGQWTGKAQTTGWGWQAEFAIRLTKLGITSFPSNRVIGFALAEVWTPAWPHDWYWPLQPQAHYINPSTWGYLLSSSHWSPFYWKPGPWEDYAPSGLPDFDQRQVSPTYCGPFAAANSLWWFDSRFEEHPAGPRGSPPTLPISDSYTLVRPYGNWDDHDPRNVVSLTRVLANYFKTDTNPAGPGTHIYDMYDGMQRYLRDRGLWDDYIVTLVNKPAFPWIAEEVRHSEDVILLLGFWQEQPPTSGIWVRVGGHFVTVAGVDSTPGAEQIALSDPVQDFAEMGGAGRVLSGTLITHYPPHPGPNATVHNDAGNVSHDRYGVLPGSPSPGGSWWIPGYEPPLDLLGLPGLNPNPKAPGPPLPYVPVWPVHTEIEYALSVSPYDWKASGRWVDDPTVPLYGKSFVPFNDFAPSGMPDFDQKQDNWGRIGPLGWQWTFCGPVAAANSLWWFDSKFELQGLVPPAVRDSYPLVWPYGPWDDHHPLNVDNPGTPWPPPGWPQPPPSWPPIGPWEFIEDLALRFATDQVGGGTVITDVYTGLDLYLGMHGLRQGYVITQVHQPEFWWLAEEVERSEDVILLLGFWALVAPGQYERAGGHYVTLAGVDKQGGLIGFSDPYWDRMEIAGLPGKEFSGAPQWTGRIGKDGDPPLGPSGLVPTYTHAYHTGVYTRHNDAANVSHDVYRAYPTDSPGGDWGPGGYVTETSFIANFIGQNGPFVVPSPGLPVQTEVEWAVSVSPVADVTIVKRVTPPVVENGDRITFTLSFTNVGSLPAQGIVVSDLLPSQLTSTSWSAWISNGGVVTAGPGPDYGWNVPDLAWNEWGVITVTGLVNTAELFLVVTNTAAITTTSVEQYQVSPLPNTAQAPFVIDNRVYGVDLQPSSASQWGNPNTTVTYTLTLHNPGNTTDSYTITGSVSNSPWTTTWPATVGPVGAGLSAPVAVTVQIPPGAANNAWSRAVITATSQADPSLKDTSVLTTTATTQAIVRGVKIFPHFLLGNGDPGDVVTCTLRITNSGNFADLITLSFSGPSTWTVHFSANPVALGAGQGTNVQVYVGIPASAHAGTVGTFTITATSQGDPTQHDQATLKTLVSWRLLHVPLLLKQWHR